MGEIILQVKDLAVQFNSPDGAVRVVDGVTFDIKKGEVFGLVGGSGSGKTLTALSMLKLLPPQARIVFGKIFFMGCDLIWQREEEMRALRGSRISIVFQEPGSSLDPVFTIGSQMMEVITAHREVKKDDARDIVIKYLKRVHIPSPEKIFYDYPHQLSGGTKQRIMIAMALMNSPELVILDEPTTALDVTIQSQILDLLGEIIEKDKLSALFISHDFGIIKRMCGSLAVMNKGRIVEAGDTAKILAGPKDPYTISLLESVRALS